MAAPSTTTLGAAAVVDRPSSSPRRCGSRRRPRPPRRTTTTLPPPPTTPPATPPRHRRRSRPRRAAPARCASATRSWRRPDRSTATSSTMCGVVDTNVSRPVPARRRHRTTPTAAAPVSPSSCTSVRTAERRRRRSTTCSRRCRRRPRSCWSTCSRTARWPGRPENNAFFPQAVARCGSRCVLGGLEGLQRGPSRLVPQRPHPSDGSGRDGVHGAHRIAGLTPAACATRRDAWFSALTSATGSRPAVSRHHSASSATARVAIPAPR